MEGKLQNIQIRFGEKLKRKKGAKNINLILFFVFSLLFLIFVLLGFAIVLLFMNDWRIASNCLYYSTSYGNNSTFIVEVEVKHVSPITPKIIEDSFKIDKYEVDETLFADIPQCWMTIVYGRDGKFIDKFTRNNKQKEADRYSAYLITLYIFGFLACGIFLLSTLCFLLFREKKKN